MIARATLASLVALVLRHVDMRTVSTTNPARARQHLGRHPAIVVADLTVPGAQSMLASAAERGVLTVALVDLESGASSFRAFARGADQVVRIPFTPDELAVRVAALQRRFGQRLSFTRAQPVDGLELNLDEQVHIGSRTIRLDPSLNSLLYLLAARPGRRLAFDDVRRLAWGVERDATDEDVARRLASLARKLDGRTIDLDIDTANGTAALHSRS